MNNVLITNIDHFGRGIGKLYDKVVFIPNTLIGESVNVEIIKNKKNFFEGKVISFDKQSLARVIPKCPYYLNCGGCNIMHMSYKDQLLFKENKVKEVINKFSHLDIKISKIIGTNEFNYRNKITLQVNKVVGFYKSESYEIVPIDNCILCDDRINKIIKKLKMLDLSNINQIMIRCGIDVMILICLCGRANEEEIVKELKSDCNSIIKKYKNEYKCLYGNNYITECIGDYKYNVSADSFFQVNNDGAKKIYDIVKENVFGRTLDLYCGTGSIGIYVSEKTNDITGLEINKYAVKDAIKNASLNNVNVNFICDDAKNIEKYVKKDFDTIIVDPPRSGLDKNTINFILNSKAEKILYVSCDVTSLARDLNILKEKYNVSNITPVDMFPNTYHVECVCVLNRR